jgi:hypothetical protein
LYFAPKEPTYDPYLPRLIRERWRLKPVIPLSWQNGLNLLFYWMVYCAVERLLMCEVDAMVSSPCREKSVGVISFKEAYN